MIDREKVIKALECCGYSKFMDKCQECPYDGRDCFKRLKSDALALLKEQEKAIKFQSDRLDELLKAQEPVEPVHEDERPISPLRCGNCGAFVMITAGYKAKYCFECGRGVKWNDTE